MPASEDDRTREGLGQVALIWGLGRFGGGLGSLLHLHRRGYELRIMDRQDPADLRRELAQVAELDEMPTMLPEVAESLEGIDLLVINPAIPLGHPLLAQADQAGIRQTQELDLFLGAYPGRVHAVTGTNGKSTTASLMAEGLRALGRDVLLGGNIGKSLCLDETHWRADQDAILEISSFQAARLETRRIDTLSFTPILRDHVAWHGSLERYQSDKLRLIGACRAEARIYGFARCPVLTRATQRFPERAIILLGGPAERRPGHLPNGTPYLDERQDLIHSGHKLLAADAFALPGHFNRENLLLALASLELDLDSARTALRGMQAFRGLPHRLAPAGMRHGVRLIDNGVSTVLDTTCLALDVLAADLAPGTRLHLVLGGKPKEPSLDEALERLPGPAASLHLFGQVGPRLASLLLDHGLATPTLSDRPTQALACALSTARPGDTILFSPGLASQDQFPNFRVRAEEALAWWNR